VWTYARKLGLPDGDADDVVQETMIGAIAAIREGRYDPAKGTLKAFLRGQAYHKICDYWRRQARRAQNLVGDTTGADAMAKMASTDDDPEEIFDTLWEKQALSVCLERVREETAPTTYQAFDLYALKGWPPAKVAEFLDISRNAVYIAKTRVLSRVRSVYEEMWPM
jgi:RNA polymerase sigma-70 factor (ECF subfamily)